MAFNKRITDRTSHWAVTAIKGSISNGCQADNERRSEFAQQCKRSGGTTAYSGIDGFRLTTQSAELHCWEPYFLHAPRILDRSVADFRNRVDSVFLKEVCAPQRLRADTRRLPFRHVVLRARIRWLPRVFPATALPPFDCIWKSAS